MSEFRVSQKKLLFLHHLVNIDQDALASEVFSIQRDYNLSNIIDMEPTITQLRWKHKVRGAIISKYEDIWIWNVKICKP